MLISDKSRMGSDPLSMALDRISSLTQSDPDTPLAIQWREKSQSPDETFAELQSLQRQLLEPGSASSGMSPHASGRGSSCTSGTALPCALIVNDRVDFALALGLPVHLTETSIPVRAARSILPATQWIGRSVHSLDAAKEAEADGATYIQFGPIFDTPAKREFGCPQGLDALRHVCAEIQIPVVAVGGIDSQRLLSVFEAGAAAWAAIDASWPRASR